MKKWRGGSIFFWIMAFFLLCTCTRKAMAETVTEEKEVLQEEQKQEAEKEQREPVIIVYLDGQERAYFQPGVKDFLLILPNRNYEVTAVVYNPMEKECKVAVRDQNGRQTKKEKLGAGKEKTVTFRGAVVENEWILSFQGTDSEEKAVTQDVDIQVRDIQIRTLEEKKREKMTLHLIGDSIMHSTGEKLYPRQGIGQNLYRYFDDGKVLKTEILEADNKLNSFTRYQMKNMTIQNWSAPGHSTKSFWENGSFDNMLCEVAAGDCVMVHFGHNDSRSQKTDVWTSVTDYERNLVRFVRGCQERGATCILLPAPPLGKFKNGKVKNCSTEYKNALKNVAVRTGCILVDTAKEIGTFMNNIGEKNAKSYYMILDAGIYANYPNGLKDTTHFNEKGAKKLAQITASMVKDNKSVPKELRQRIHVDSDYYKGITASVKSTKITKKKGKYTLSWKKQKATKDYVVYSYNQKTKKYKKIAVTKKTSYKVPKKYNKKQRKQMIVKVRFSKGKTKKK